MNQDINGYALHTQAFASISPGAAAILNEVRPAMECNPDGAQAAALRLVTLRAVSEAESAVARGGLAPWQRRKIDQHVRENLDHPLFVEELARHVSLSASHFNRAFKETFGTTPHTHIVRLRLELAQQLLLTTEEPLSQIALACGMTDQSHLSRLFRRGVGETPGAWRRRNSTDASCRDKATVVTVRKAA